MWNYTEEVMEHFRNPRNVGYLKDADGVGEVGSLACGDALKLMFKLDDEGRIVDVKFQTFGCGSAIASSSALTEMVRGKTLDEAERITNQEIAEYLGGLPKEKMHCSVMGREALQAAIANYRNGGVVTRAPGETTVCACFGVTEGQIEQAITENELSTVEQVTNYTKAGGGCGGCHDHIEELLARFGKAQPDDDGPPRDREDAPPPPRDIPRGRERRVRDAIEYEVRPALKRRGEDITLEHLDGDMVRVTFTCPNTGKKVNGYSAWELAQGLLAELVDEELVLAGEVA